MIQTSEGYVAPDYETQEGVQDNDRGRRAASDRSVSTAKATLDVTVKVTNVDEAGMVTLDTRQPQVGNAVMASVMDPDGGEKDVTWQWYRVISGAPDLSRTVHAPTAEDRGLGHDCGRHGGQLHAGHR